MTPFGVVITNIDKIKDAFSNAFDWILQKAEDFWETLTGIFDKIGSGFSKVGDIIGNIPGLGIPSSTAGAEGVGRAGAVLVPISRAIVGGVPQAGARDGGRFGRDVRG